MCACVFRSLLSVSAQFHKLAAAPVSPHSIVVIMVIMVIIMVVMVIILVIMVIIMDTSCVHLTFHRVEAEANFQQVFVRSRGDLEREFSMFKLKGMGEGGGPRGK